MVTRRRGRWALGVTIILAWAVILAWHVRREYFQPLHVRLAEASANLIPAASFFAIKLGDNPIGYAASRIDTVAGGFVLEDDMRLRIQVLGSNASAIARTRARLGEHLELQDFEFALQSDLGEFKVRGAMNGDSLLDLEIDAGGELQIVAMPTHGPIVLPQMMPMHFALGSEPKAGDTYSFEIFDPSIMERQRVSMEVVGRETLVFPDSAVLDEASNRWVAARYDTVETWHVRQGYGGIEIESWLDPDGQIVKATSPMGYKIERTAFEIAWNAYRDLGSAPVVAPGLDAPDIIEQTAISVGVELPRGEHLGALAVRLRNVDLTGFDLDGERQRLSDDTLFIYAESPLTTPSFRLPADSERFGAELSATPLIQVDDPLIRETAERAVDGTTDPVLAAERLTRWVYGNLDKEITLSVPSARQVLEARRGDCNEHTVLYVALARAVGLPTRTAAGLVYVRDRFYYHAWPEVWLDRWVAVDPTLDQFPADASHLRFVIGGLARQVELVRLIGLLELDVVSVEEK